MGENSMKGGTPEFNGYESSVQVADIRMGYCEYGSGDPLLLIMGYGSTMNLWEQGLISNLASRFRVIIFDNRGIGMSTTGTKPFSIVQFCEDTAGFMDAIGLQQAHVMGWSMGSLIAQELAIRHPSKVGRLILYATYCSEGMFPPSPEIIEQLTDMTGTPQDRGMRFIRTLFPESWLHDNGRRLGEIFFRPMGNLPEETLQQQSKAIDEWSGTTLHLGEIRHQVLLISGTDDFLVPPMNQRFMFDKIPHAQQELIEDGGHGLMFQFPELFCDKVLRFLA